MRRRSICRAAPSHKARKPRESKWLLIHSQAWAKINPETQATQLLRTAEKQRFFHGARVHYNGVHQVVGTFEQPHNVHTRDVYISDDNFARQSSLEPVFVQRLLEFRGTPLLQKLSDIDICYQPRPPFISSAGVDRRWMIDFWSVHANVLWQVDGEQHQKKALQWQRDMANAQAALEHNEYIASKGVPSEFRWFLSKPYKLARVHFLDVINADKCRQFITFVLHHAQAHEQVSCIYYSSAYTEPQATAYREHAIPKTEQVMFVHTL